LCFSLDVLRGGYEQWTVEDKRRLSLLKKRYSRITDEFLDYRVEAKFVVVVSEGTEEI
jgi:hypothetical protein